MISAASVLQALKGTVAVGWPAQGWPAEQGILRVIEGIVVNQATVDVQELVGS